MLNVSLTLVQDVAHSLCNEAETQMRIADRRIFLKKTKQKANKKTGPAPLHLNTRCHTTQRAARCFYSEKKKGNTNGSSSHVWSGQDFSVCRFGVNSGFTSDQSRATRDCCCRTNRCGEMSTSVSGSARAEGGAGSSGVSLSARWNKMLRISAPAAGYMNVRRT